MNDRISTILSTIAEQTTQHLEHKINQKCAFDISVLGGDFGAVCFLLEYSRIDSKYTSVADKYFDMALESMPRYRYYGTYCNGLAGFALALLILEEHGLVSGAKESMDSIDLYVLKNLNRQIEHDELDFLHGIIGYGFYLLKRWESAPETAKTGLTQIIKYLDEKKVINADGNITWTLKKEEESDKHNISLSHGMSSIVVLLSRIATMGLKFEENINDTVFTLLRGAVGYILSQRIPNSGDEFPNLYPSTWLYRHEPVYSRMAWCYGDLGISVGLYYASVALCDNNLKKDAHEIIINSTKRRSFAETSVYDKCICHGAAGIYLIMNRMAQIYNDEKIGDCAKFWKRYIIDGFSIGECCYPYFNSSKKAWTHEWSLLEGVSGIGMSLLPDKSFINNILLLDL